MPAQQENLRNGNPENGNVRPADAAELIRYNPAALIINEESYRRMRNFSPDRFDRPHVVAVDVYSSEHGPVTRDFVLDGMTRTKYYYDNAAKIQAAHLDFQFEVRDVTASVLKDDEVVPPSERRPGQRSLTLIQYLRAVIPPTVEHTKIASDRIAAHLMNGWQSMVGEDIARKYSALAAFGFLGRRDINIATDQALRRDLAQHGPVVISQTEEEGKRLEEGLLQMAAVIRQTKLIRSEVARAAFVLVSAASPVIGGEREARQQIYGMLHLPEVERKIRATSQNAVEQERVRGELGEQLFATFRKFAWAPRREETLNVVVDTLRDPDLSLRAASHVYASDNPVTAYAQAREEINHGKLADSYRALKKDEPLSPVEEQLLGKLGRQTLLSEVDIRGIQKAIQDAHGILSYAESMRSQLSDSRERLLASGVPAEMLDQADQRLQSAMREVSNASATQTLQRAARTLSLLVHNETGRITRHVTFHRTGLLVDAQTGEQLKTGYGPQIRVDIISLVVGEFPEITAKNEREVNRRIEQLLRLDHEFLLKVKNGDMTLSFALAQQEERKRTSQVQTAKPPLSLPSAEPVAPPQAAQPSTQQPAGESTQAEVFPAEVRAQETVAGKALPQPEATVIDHEQLNALRIQKNQEKLQTALEEIVRQRADIDLAHGEITEAQGALIDDLVDWVGVLRYGQPQASDVLKTRYRQTLKDIQTLRQDKARRDLEDLTQSTLQ